MDAIIVGIVLLACLVYDLKLRKIPNYMTLPFLLAGVIYTFLTYGIRGFGYSFLNVLLVLVIFLYGFIKSYMGAGDIKLLLAMSFWMNTEDMIVFILSTLIIGAVISVGKMIINVQTEHKKQVVKVDELDPVVVVNRLKMKSGKTIAYAVPIFLGYFFTLFLG